LNDLKGPPLIASLSSVIFTARCCYASVVYAVIVCPSVCHKSEVHKDDQT